jgi:tetratricopeptide (TPR) repeat protein
MGLHALAILTLVFGFADQLYESGDYEMAALEYARILYSEEDTLDQPEAALRLARCWHALGRFEESLGLYGRLMADLPDHDYRASAALGAGTVYADMGFFSRSEELYTLAAETARDSELVYRGELLAALTPLYRQDWLTGNDRLSQVAARWSGERRELAADLAVLAARGENLPGRSPVWCGLASALVPGSGQMLCGHVKDGLTAFGLTVATGALFYLSLEEENLSTTILLGWLTFSFYGANIYGGSRAAEYYNTTRRRELYEEVRDRLEGQSGS